MLAEYKLCLQNALYVIIVFQCSSHVSYKMAWSTVNLAYAAYRWMGRGNGQSS